jgi:hypothetical protein
MVFDFDTQDGMDFLVTEYIPGTTLDASVGPGFLPEKQVVRLAIAVKIQCGCDDRQTII